MAKLSIRWTETAIAEFGRMLNYYNIRNGNSKYSRSIVKMVRESLKLIAKYPLMYRSVDTEEIRDVRVFHCDFFLIYYRILESEILVEVVSDARQDPNTLNIR